MSRIFFGFSRVASISFSVRVFYGGRMEGKVVLRSGVS